MQAGDEAQVNPTPVPRPGYFNIFPENRLPCAANYS